MSLDLNYIRQLSEQIQHEDGRAFINDALDADYYVRSHQFDGSLSEYLQQASADHSSDVVFLACVFHELMRNCPEQ